MLPTQDQYSEIFLSGAPLIDTRAPIEFARGSFPGAINLPLMSDDERAAVGTCYKQSGQDAAIALGHQLVSGSIKSDRIAAWAAFVQQNAEGYLFCFRGGLRSQIVQRWLAEEAGLVYPRIAGGYKAMRHFLIAATDRIAAQIPLLVIGGMTGTGKTELLNKLKPTLDLEGCANHRGSGFGRLVSEQPAQIDFEHALAIRMLNLEASGAISLIVEDEGHFIGSCSIPEALYMHMQQAPILWLEDAFENRVSRILQDYVIAQRADHDQAYGVEGAARFASHLLDSLFRIRKRLGGERYERARALMTQALACKEATGETQLHRGWISLLLSEYYDPMYQHQKQAKKARIIAAGEAQDIMAYMQTKE